MSNVRRPSGRSSHGMQGVFVFVLLGLFAIMSTLLVLLGAQMYRGTVENANLNNDARVLTAYVRSMVRAGDLAEGVSVEEYDGVRVIALRESWEDADEEDGVASYVTWLYPYEGQLCELFSSDENEFDPDLGEPICAVTAFEPELAEGFLTVRMQDAQGRPCEVRLALRAS